jgi:hypothetical protein
MKLYGHQFIMVKMLEGFGIVLPEKQPTIFNLTNNRHYGTFILRQFIGGHQLKLMKRMPTS